MAIELNSILFSIITLFVLIWFFLICRKRMLNTLFLLYFFLNFTLFYGPLLYYKFGFTGYYYAVDNKSLESFMYIAICVFIINIYFFLFYSRKLNGLFLQYFKRFTIEEIYNTKLLDRFYILCFSISALYIFYYRKYFPLIELFSSGELGERLDTGGVLPFYITFASFTLVFIPSGFLYFYDKSISKFLKVFLLLFTMFCLSAGGNKGIVSFFLIFFVMFCLRKGGFLKYLFLGIVLLIIYAVLKGITEVNKDSIDYLIESPFRRLFAAQGVGFVTRILMYDANLIKDGILVKQQVYSYIYGTRIGSGSSPTHFIADFFFSYGYVLTAIIYMAYLYIVNNIIMVVTYVNSIKSNIYLLWGIFLFLFITTNSEINLANTIRVIFIIINLKIIMYATKIRK